METLLITYSPHALICHTGLLSVKRCVTFHVTQLLRGLVVLFTTTYTLLVGHVEHFADKCGGVPAWLDKNTYYTAFTEGWGLYSENPLLSDDTDTYKDNLLQKYGMVKWQVRIKKLYNTASYLRDRAYISRSHNRVDKASRRAFWYILQSLICSILLECRPGVL